MSDIEIEAVLERVHPFRSMLIEAAFQADILWRNMARQAGLTEWEMPKVRAYLVEKYGSDSARH